MLRAAGRGQGRAAPPSPVVGCGLEGNGKGTAMDHVKVKTRPVGALASLEKAGRVSLVTDTGGALDVTTHAAEAGFSPIDLIHASLAACLALSARIAAGRLGVLDRFEAVRVHVTGDKAADGSNRIARFRIRIEIDGDLDEPTKRAIAELAEGEICTVSNTARAAVRRSWSKTGRAPSRWAAGSIPRARRANFVDSFAPRPAPPGRVPPIAFQDRPRARRDHRPDGQRACPLDTRLANLAAIRAAGQPKNYERPLAEARRLFIESRPPLRSGDGILSEDRTILGPAGPIPVRLYRRASATGALPILVYFHGGGFVLGRSRSA